jgi:hypothetical protein
MLRSTPYDVLITYQNIVSRRFACRRLVGLTGVMESEKLLETGTYVLNLLPLGGV